VQPVLPLPHLRTTFVTSDGSAYTRLKHALRSRNLLLVRANAAELGRVGLVDALAIVELIEELEPERFQAAAVRWAGRLALEAKGLALVGSGMPYGRWTPCPIRRRGGRCSPWPIPAATAHRAARPRTGRRCRPRRGCERGGLCHHWTFLGRESAGRYPDRPVQRSAGALVGVGGRPLRDAGRPAARRTAFQEPPKRRLIEDADGTSSARLVAQCR
jgi:hypothetical protein